MHEEFEEAAHRGQPPLNAATGETFGMRLSRKMANVLAVERTPVLQFVRVAKLHEGCEIARERSITILPREI